MKRLTDSMTLTCSLFTELAHDRALKHRCLGAGCERMRDGRHD
jgi:hypothetical protein